MADWYYYNRSGEKVGPISAAALQTLVRQGLITRETMIENHTGHTVMAGEVNGLTFPTQPGSAPETTATPSESGEVYGVASPLPAASTPAEQNPFSVPVPPQAGVPIPPSGPASTATAKGKELAQRGKEEFTKGAKEVMGGLSAAKDAVQARIKLNTLSAQLIAAFRSLGDAAEQAGWNAGLCESIRKQKEEVATTTAQFNKASSEAELAKNTPGAGAAKQASSEAKKRSTLAAGILDGLREKMGRALLEDFSAPAGIGTAQRTEIGRLKEDIAECERIIAHGKKSLLTKPMLVAAAVLVLLVACLFGFTWSVSSGKPLDRERYTSGKATLEEMDLLQKRAKRGNTEAQHILGLCYGLGEGVSKDHEENAKWQRKAAAKGHVDAQFHLSTAYLTGLGVPKDLTESEKWLRKAAEQGDAGKQHLLGMYYTIGMFGSKNVVEAAKWNRKAAKQGHAAGQYWLGMAYLEGDGVEQNDKEGIEWIRKAAEQGNADAQFALGAAYHDCGGPLKLDRAISYTTEIRTA